MYIFIYFIIKTYVIDLNSQNDSSYPMNTKNMIINNLSSSLLPHKGVDVLPEGKVKSTARYLWNFSQIHNWEKPAIVPYDDDDKIVGACIQWDCKIISYILDNQQNDIIIEVDKEGTIKEFQFPIEVKLLEDFLLE